MYSYTPTHKFLVLAPIQSGPLSIDSVDTPQLDKTKQATTASVRERSGSQSSTASNASNASQASGFLYLGHDTGAKN